MAEDERKTAARPKIAAAGAALFSAVLLATATQPAGAQLQGPNLRGPASVADVAEPLLDAVVNISTSQTLKGPQGVPLPKAPKGSPFDEFFEDFFNKKGGKGQADRKASSLGSGFVIDAKEDRKSVV